MVDFPAGIGLSQGMESLFNRDLALGENFSNLANLQNLPTNGTSFSMIQQDLVELSVEAESLLMEIQNGKNGGTTTIRDFAAEFSGSFRSQSVAQISQVGENGFSSLTAFSDYQMDFNISVRSTSVSTGTGNGGLDLNSPQFKDLKNYLIMVQTFISQIKDSLDEIMGGTVGEIPSMEELTQYVNDLADGLQDFLQNGALVNSASNGVAAALESYEINIEINISQTTIVQTQAVQQGDPIVLDLDGDGLELTDYKNGMKFDLDGNGVLDKMSTVFGGDGFLALDRNLNGLIDNGKELFGDQHGAKNGMEELRKYDENRDNVIDRKDSVFEKLLIYAEKNNDGISQKNELQTLLEAGIESISLGYKNINQNLNNNTLTQQTNFTRQDGTTGQAYDSLLQYE